MSSTFNNGNIPYLGSKISLISKAKIRYEGILYTIDPHESTVALAKVRSYGTENRIVENPLPAKDEIYEYIIFRATDIEDLQVSEPPKPTPIHETLPHMDPAIVQQASPTFHAPQQLVGPISRSSYDNNRNYDGGRRRVRTVAPPNIFRQNTFQSNRNGYRRSGRNLSFTPQHNRSPRMRNRSVGGSSLKFDGDFDFEKANEEFSKLSSQVSNLDISDKNEETPHNVTTNGKSDTESQKENVVDTNINEASNDCHFYDKKKSFFDKISCEASEREKGRESRIRKSWQEERHQNAETFGTSAASNWIPRGMSNRGNNRMMYRRGNRYPSRRYYNENNRMDMLPAWYTDNSTVPHMPLSYQPQRFNAFPSYNRREFNIRPSYTRRYPVYS